MNRTDLKDVRLAAEQPEFQALHSVRSNDQTRAHGSRWLGYPLCLLLLGGVGWELLKGGWQKGGSPIVSTALADEVPRLDCFSSPSIALAILEKEGARLFSKFAEARDAESATKATPASRQDPSRLGCIPAKDPVPDPDTTSAAVRAMEDLQANLTRLQRDVTHQLLVIYIQENQPEKFLNLYLPLLRTAPDCVVATQLGQDALDCARECGRYEEFLSALEYADRFGHMGKARTHWRALLVETRLPASTTQLGEIR
jgi:hypothetical protein